MIWDTAKAVFSVGKDLTLAKKLIISAEDTFAQLDKRSIDRPHGSSTASAFSVPLQTFKRLVGDSREKLPKDPEIALDIAKRLHRYAYGNSGILNLGKKLDAIWYESNYRAHPEVEVLHRFLEDVLLDIEMPEKENFYEPNMHEIKFELTYHRLYPISDKWRSFQHIG